MKKLSKILALVLVLCMLMAVCAFAAEGDKKDGAMPEGDKKTDGVPEGDKKDEGVPEGDVMTAEEAYVEYIREWLYAELEVNSSMTQEQVDDEFMPLIEAGDYESFPADMLYGGMLESGIAMTFEEFAAQYVPEAAAGGDTSEEAYQAYLKSYVDACPAVSDDQYLEFAALIDAGNYTDFPVEMCFTDAYWGFVAATYDEFVAAGGNVELPDFDPTLTADPEE